MPDEVRSYKVNINQDFYYKISEAIDIIKNKEITQKNKDQVTERAETDVGYENNFVENQNYEDSDEKAVYIYMGLY